jgi:predicted double-glycine peptidase
MALMTGGTTSYLVGSAGGNREDLEDVIWELDPLDTYCLTNFDRVKGDATFHEHELDTLVGVTSNRQLEGDSFSATTVVSPSRVGNYMQISKKEFIITGTQEVVSKAGRKSDVKRQLKKQMKELKNDMEYALVRNQGSSAGGATTARSSGGIESWIPSTDNSGNGVKATTTASGSTAAFASNVVAAPTDGATTGAFNETAFLAALELAWTDGGNPASILMSAANKKLAAAFSGVATKTHNVEGRTKPVIAGDVDVYVSAFGTHNFILHRHVRGNTVLCLDPTYWGVAMLRTPFMEAMAKTGDGWPHALRAEFTLVSRNHNASAKVANCTG